MGLSNGESISEDQIRTAMENMMNFYAENSHDHCNGKAPWPFDDKINEIECVEIFSQDGGVSTEIEFSKHTSRSFSKWLESPKHSSYLRLVLATVDYTAKSRLKISKSNFNRVLQGFDVERVFQFTHSSTFAFNTIPKYVQQGALNAFYCCLHVAHYSSMCVVYDPAASRTQGIYAAPMRNMERLRAALKSLKVLAKHPCFSILCGAAAFTSASDFGQYEVQNQIAAVEKRTGYACVEWNPYSSKGGSLSELAAEIGSYGSSLNRLRRGNRLAEQALAAADDSVLIPDGVDQQIRDMFASHTRLIKERLRIQLLDFDYMTNCVQSQSNAVSNLSARQEMNNNLKLARDTRTVALASQRDSSSMKTLAAVTTVFLPGTSVATLFSMSMFEWNSTNSSPVVTSRFWIYWSITIPLTILTVAAWLYWDYRQALLSRRADEESSIYEQFC